MKLLVTTFVIFASFAIGNPAKLPGVQICDSFVPEGRA